MTITARVDNETPALSRTWHAVLTSDELADRPIAVELLGEPWMVARLGQDVVAFVDRCPHRMAPLSLGTVCGVRLQCQYHGWVFDASGACVDIPSLGPEATIPPRAVVRSAAAVTERYGLVWVSPQPPLFDLPAFAEWDDPAFVNSMNEPRRTTVSAGQLVDNFLDATHLRTVHAGTFGVDDGGYLPPSEIVRDGWKAHTTFDVNYKNYDDPLVATGDHPLVQPQRLYKEIAGPTAAIVRLFHPLTGKTVSFLFACSPSSATSTRVFKLMARDDLTDPATQIPPLLAFEDRVLDEDLAVLEPYRDKSVSTDLRQEISVRSDRLSVAYRRILGELVEHDASLCRGVSPYIPVIDLRAPRHEVAATIDAAARESGFLVVTGHGIDPDLIQRMHDVTLELFRQPADWKQQWRPPADVAGLRGMHLVPSRVSAAEDIATAPDLCEMFTMSRLGEPGVAAGAGLDGAPDGWHAANIWPDRPAGLRDTWLEYYAAMEALADDLMRLFAIGLGLAEDHFAGYVDEHITNLTANHYPGVDAPPLPDQFRKGPHSDWGTLTILYQDGTGGLEVLDRRSGGWVDVPVLEGTFVVNIGDLMATWTNDQWRSTKHRVRVPPPERRAVERVSIPYFHHPNWSALIECLPGCEVPGEEPHFAPVTAGEYLMRKVAAAYT